MHGLPCIPYTRVTVGAVQAQLDAGLSIDELLADYPYLERKDVLAPSEYTTDSRLSDLELRAHGLAESPEGVDRRQGDCQGLARWEARVFLSLATWQMGP
jgi:uncharacterized protein (DUF433 family)